MYTTAHAAAGVAIALALAKHGGNEAYQYTATAVLAYGSHYCMDFVKEYNPGSAKKLALFELPLIVAILVTLCWPPVAWLCLTGAVMANLPDIIDKSLYAFGRSTVLSCHTAEWERYPATKVDTWLFSIGGVVLLILWRLGVFHG